jgi:TetR/AcrR family transcriptional regulator, cholesterol catabolism regulator
VPRLTAIRKQALDEVMKKAFFDATVAVLSEHGVEGMTMDRVASAASVAKGSLYHYFRSKKDLLEFVYAKIIDPIFQDLSDTVATERPAIEKLASHLHKLLEHVAKHATVFRLLFDDDTAHGLLQASERNSRETGSRRLAEIFSQGIAEGAFHAADPLTLARMFLGLCRGVFDGQPELQERTQRECAHRLILGAFLNGIATEEVRVA